MQRGGLVVGPQDPTVGADGEHRGQVWKGGGRLLDEKPDGGTRCRLEGPQRLRENLSRYQRHVLSHSLERDVKLSLVFNLQGQFVLLEDPENSKV